MNSKVNHEIDTLRAAKRGRQRLTALLLALTCGVSGQVFWSLRSIGHAMTSGAEQAHQHSAECYEQTCICTETDPAHEHAAACYEERLVCEPDASDPEADLETAAVWEATLPRLPAGSRRAAAAQIARSQLGVRESVRNFTVSEDGVQHGLTRYGTWYGTPYGDWNAMFASFCLYYAGVTEADMPLAAGCTAWTARLSDAKLLLSPADGTPETGDLIFLDSDGDQQADRAAIVTAPPDAESGMLYAVEGDCDDAVAENQYLWTDPQIVGWAATPEDPDAMPAQSFTGASEGGITVAAYAAEGIFPAGTAMTVTDIAAEEMLEAVEDETPLLGAVAVDITFRDRCGNELEPAEGAAVQVSIALPAEQQLRAGEFALLHQRTDGTVEEIADAAVTGSGAQFSAESFSVYVVTSRGLVDGDTAILVEKGVHLGSLTYNKENYLNSINNSAANRYPLEIGEVIEVEFHQTRASANVPWSEVDLHINENKDPNCILYRAIGGDNVTTEPDATHRIISAKYYAARPGDCEVVCGGETLYLHVRQPIYVQTPLGEIEKDRVHEFLDRAIWDRGNQASLTGGVNVLLDENGNPLYVVNSNSSQGRYFIPPQGEFTLVTYSLDESTDFTVSDPNQIQKITETRKVSRVENMPSITSPQVYRIEQRFRAIGPGAGVEWGGCSSVITVGGEPFYVHIRDIENSDNKYHHSDIEIADGSYYYFESTVTNPDGTYVTESTAYDACVVDVLRCHLFDKDGSRIKNLKGEPLEYITEDYTSEGAPGTSQYELTSQVKCADNSDKWYDVKNVRGAEFEVNVMLRANSMTRTTCDADGNVLSTEQYNVKGQPDYPDIHAKQTYQLGYDAVITALNKCPARNGLDFNIKANTLVIEPRALKRLGANKPGSNKFAFDLIEQGNVIDTQENDSEGDVVFNKLFYTEPGTYVYSIREQLPDSGAEDDRFIYDDHTETLTVQVSRDRDGKLHAELVYQNDKTGKTSNSSASFTNTPKYTLPATGGTGTIGFLLVGTGCIAAAVLLSVRMRKRESEAL